jgi:hypothetical protein
MSERERERNASALAMRRESEKKRRGIRFVPHDEQGTAPSFSLSLHMRVARSSIAFCIASLLTHAHTHIYGANLGECRKKNKGYEYIRKKISVFHA